MRKLGSRGRIVAGLALAALLTASCAGGDTESEEPGPPAAPGRSTPRSQGPGGGGVDPRRLRLSLQPVVEGLSAPLAVVDAGDGSGRLFVVEQGGRVRIVRGQGVETEAFLDISGLTTPGGEQGLLGLAFHPNYERNGRLFVNYTDTMGDTVVAEYGVDASNPGRVDPSTARVLMRIDQPFPNHNGGALEFGPDGNLYIATGDGGSGGDPMDNGQSLDTLLGKLLRVDVDAPPGKGDYGIPEDNPFVGRAGARPEIWAYGLRNPWRFTFDRRAGDLWIGDVGQDSLEEIDRSPADAAGLNYGWNEMEGSACYEPSEDCERDGLVVPLAEYSHDLGCSVTGGYVYRGLEYRILRGVYLFADYCSGTIWGLDSGGPDSQAPIEVLATGAQVSSFGEDENGELYLVDAAAGTLHRITARAR